MGGEWEGEDVCVCRGGGGRISIRQDLMLSFISHINKGGFFYANVPNDHFD